MLQNSRIRIWTLCAVIAGLLTVNSTVLTPNATANSSADLATAIDLSEYETADVEYPLVNATQGVRQRGIVRFREIKIVPVRFCLVDDGMNPHGAPSGRFSAANRLAALLLKSLIWARVGILFVPQGRAVVIDDPSPPPAGPGANGDLLGVPNVDSPEITAARAACNRKIGRDAREKIVDIVARRFVDAAGAPTGLNGRASRVDECALNTLPDKTVVKDPDAFPNFFRCANAGGGGSFVRTLAHENGHALSLPHPNPMPVGRLMSQTGVTNGCKLTAAEGAQARREADKKLSGVKKKNRFGLIVQEPKPRTRIAVDNIGDSRPPWTDIVEATATRRPDQRLGLETYLASVVPPNTEGLKYVFLVDVDNNPGSGGSPDLGFAHRARGIDLVVEIDVSTGSGPRQRSVTSRVRKFSGRRFIDVVDKRIEAALVTVREADDVDKPMNAQGEFPSFDVVKFVLPADLLPRPLVENFRVSSFAFDSQSKALDEAPVVEGSITNFPEPSLIQLSTLAGGVGRNVVVSGVGFTPNSEVEIYLGRTHVAKAATDRRGRFQSSFTVPQPSDETFIEGIDGDTISAVTAVDSEFVSDAMIFSVTGSPQQRPRARP